MPKPADFGVSPLGAFAKCVRAVLPRLNYLAMYQARVVKHDPVTQLLDVLPDDADLPSISGLQFRLGLPGATMTLLVQGTTVMIGWSEGDPARPYACLPGGGEHVGAMTLNADQLTLGGDAGAEPAIKGTTYRDAEDAMLTTFSGLMTTATALCHAATNPATTMAAVQGIAVMLDGMIAAIAAFKAGAPGYLATNVLVK